MKKSVVLAGVIFLAVASVSYTDSIEIGAAMVWNPVAFHDPAVGGGVSLAFSLSQPNHFGFGLFYNMAFAPSKALFDFMTGPIFEFAINDKLSVIPCVGLYVGMIFFGLGGNVTVEYALLPRLALFGRVQYARATFLAPGVDSVKTHVVSPSIGVAWRLW